MLQGESINKLINGDREVLRYLLEKNPDLQRLPLRISIEELLAFKDRLQIPDDEWGRVMSTFGLNKEHSRYQIEKERKRVNEMFTLIETPRKLGIVMVCT